MDINDLVELYQQKRAEFGELAYKHISALLEDAKKQHKIDFLQSA